MTEVFDIDPLTDEQLFAPADVRFLQNLGAAMAAGSEVMPIYDRPRRPGEPAEEGDPEEEPAPRKSPSEWGHPDDPETGDDPEKD